MVRMPDLRPTKMMSFVLYQVIKTTIALLKQPHAWTATAPGFHEQSTQLYLRLLRRE